jgi:hypothetical protein
MRIKRVSSDTELLAKLREQEQQLSTSPSLDSYVQLADAYRSLGMKRQADRMLQMAEALENGASAPPPPADGLLSGAVSPTMLVEVIQILTRTKLSGEFIIDAKTQTFRLYFDHGHIINALSAQHSPGLDSFQMALRVTQGSYRFIQKSILDIPRLIDEPPDLLLLNAMQEADEQTAEL